MMMKGAGVHLGVLWTVHRRLLPATAALLRERGSVAPRRGQHRAGARTLRGRVPGGRGTPETTRTDGIAA